MMPDPSEDVGWLVGGGEMGERTRAFDWAATPLGPITAWPQSLKTAVSIMLGCEYPLLIWWGPQLIHFYNDAYIPVLGQRHPSALGQPAPAVWSEAWPLVGPQADAVMQDGRSYWNEELLIVMTRNGYPEEVYMTFSYGPIRDDDGGIGGVFCACTEETPRVVDRRRLRTLRALADRSAQGKTAEEACEIAAATLGENAYDLPFALLYLLDADGHHARLAGATGLAPGGLASPTVVAVDDANAPWPLHQVIARGQAVDCEGLTERLDVLPGGPWPEPTQRAAVLPMVRPAQTQPAGFVVAGISPRRPLDESYRGFLALAAGQVASSIANARAYEEERKRAEALAELDRAKTAFFSNVSHEFRTPLTLMLGPLEDVLAEGDGLPDDVRAELEVSHRSAQRLLRLVNTLLDFSRIEAGRIEASYEPTDLAAFTTELASVFRSAIERAGLRLVVDCPPLGEPVWIDREMWEKIVLNLLSNAFKFTFAGEIEVALRREGNVVRLAVRDTGTGIPPAEQPRVFERFHRVRDARGRTFEGSGIGLALVREMVHLHAGEVELESEVGQGSTFTVTIPLGHAHLPADRLGATRTLASTGVGADAYVAEVLRWLPSGGREENAPAPGDDVPPRADLDSAVPARHADPDTVPARVLVVDDNADMREYLVRLLQDRYEVVVAEDGQAALRVARAHPPDLVLADVMMPRLDGFGLLAALRADAGLRTVPVIMLSARAGEEARVEGMEAGADDYLVKPFSARELLARVDGALRLQQVRREAASTLAESEARLAEATLLQTVSSQLLQADGVDVLYGQILDAALALGRADAGSMQMLDPDTNALVLLTERGFAPASAAFWHRVTSDSDSSCGAALTAGARVVVPDVEAAAFLAGSDDLDAYRRSGIRAVQSTPLVTREGRIVGMLSTHWRDAHRPTDRELRLLDVLARQAADLLERARAEAALRESEAKYRTLFDAIDQGFCTVEVLFDSAGKAVDYVFLEINPAFVRNTGLTDAVGRRMRELAPAHEEYWFATYGRIARTDVAERFEAEAAALGRWYNIYAFRVGDPGQHRVAILFEDITARKRTEEALRESEASLQRRVTEATTELRSLSRRLLAVQEEERWRLALELHDEIGQVLTGLNFQLAAAAGKDGRVALAEAQATVQALTEQVRQLSMDLRPAVLDRFGLLPALQWHLGRYQQQTGITVAMQQLGLDERFPPEVEIGAFRVVQEALTNIARHAGVAAATIHLVADAETLTIVIRDRGRGFSPERIGVTSGLSGMRERVALLGGSLEVESMPGGGTIVTAEIPLGDRADPGPESHTTPEVGS